MDAPAAGQETRGESPSPAAERRRRARKSLIALIPTTTAAYALAGHTVVWILDLFRLMIIDVDIDVENIVRGPLPFLLTASLSYLLGRGLTRQATAVFATLRAGAAMGWSVGLGGTALGLLNAWLSGQWAQPPEPGRSAPEEGGDWGPAVWIAYHVTWLLPLLFGVAAVAGLLWIARTHGHARWPGTKAAEIKEHGVMMPGIIDQVEFTGAWVGGEPRFALTVDYLSERGPRRTVEHFVTPLEKVPVRGGQVDVWYDTLGEDGMVLIELNERSFGSTRYPDRQ